MNIERVSGKLRLRVAPKELTLLIISKFFNNLSTKIAQDSLNETELSNYVKQLANKSVDSTDYEFFIAILELYKQFNRNCEFGFNLKNNFDIKTDRIITLDDISKYREDPPDIIVFYNGNEADFEFKRYRGDIDFDPIFSFLKNKIINHYSDKANYLILLQPEPNSNISFDLFSKIHNEIVKLNKDFGRIAFTLNHDNFEIITAFVYPKFEVSKREYSSEHELFSDILKSD